MLMKKWLFFLLCCFNRTLERSKITVSAQHEEALVSVKPGETQVIRSKLQIGETKSAMQLLSFFRWMVLIILAGLIVGCSIYPTYPKPNGTLSLFVIESFLGRNTTYSQVSLGNTSLQEKSYSDLKKGTAARCVYNVESIRVSVFETRETPCIAFKDEPPMLNIKLPVDVEFYYLDEENFYIRHEIAQNRLVFATSKNIFRKKYYESNSRLHLYALFTTLHEAFHYLHLIENPGGPVSYEREEILANVFAFVLLKNKITMSEFKEFLHKEMLPADKLSLSQITKSLNAEVEFLKIIDRENEVEEYFNEALLLIGVDSESIQRKRAL